MIEMLNIMPKEFMYHYYETHSEPCMAMAHLILEDDEYFNFVKELKEKGTHIVLDNSAPYLGKSIAGNLLLKCIDLIEPDEVVLPDSIGNYKDTVETTINLLDTLGKTDMKLMAVPQGANLKEYEACYKLFSSMEEIDYIGLSYTVGNIIEGDYLTARENVIAYFQDNQIFGSKEHHLLGCSDSGHLEIKRLKRFDCITRCDSNAAYKVADDGLVMNELGYKKTKGMTFDTPFDEMVYSRMLQNIEVLTQLGERS